jgi:hypothetical protein
MDKKRKPSRFVPEGLETGKLEDRVVMNSSFKFPVELGPIVTGNYRGAWVLTSRTYAQVQNQVNAAIRAFGNQFARAYQQTGGPGAALDARLTPMLSQLDRIMQMAESRIPYGLGRAGVTGGVGLSNLTAPTSTSNTTGLSVAEHLQFGLESVVGPYTLAEARQYIEAVRQSALAIVGTNAPLAAQIPGFLPGYITAWGPQGAGAFGLRNSR